MLIQFLVNNFRSFRDETTLSMVASKDKEQLDTHTFKTEINAAPYLLKGAAIFGGNGSGKSNLLNALSYFQQVVVNSATIAVNREFSVKPFLLDPKSKSEPSTFEITFLKEKIRYQYGFSLNRERIIEEWLLVYKNAKPQIWFTRTFSEDIEEYKYYFGPSLKGQKDIWKQATRKNALFLSIASQFNSEQLTDVLTWIEKDLIFFGNSYLAHDKTVELLQDNFYSTQIKDFITSADLGISDIFLEFRKQKSQQLSFNLHEGTTDMKLFEEDRMIPFIEHKSNGEVVNFELMDESLGTQRIFALAGPILQILREGKVLIFDELDSSLHTILAKKLIEMFHSDSNNTNPSQIIFSTHDTELMKHELLRRDQIWFVEKGYDLSSKLYPLTDFGPRKKEDLEKGYLNGRYGAIPLLEGIFTKESINNGD
jgi:AAA15 family ATPase/GTPase